jgi:hypothetical protein
VGKGYFFGGDGSTCYCSSSNTRSGTHLDKILRWKIFFWKKVGKYTRFLNNSLFKMFSAAIPLNTLEQRHTSPSASFNIRLP